MEHPAGGWNTRLLQQFLVGPGHEDRRQGGLGQADPFGPSGMFGNPINTSHNSGPMGRCGRGRLYRPKATQRGRPWIIAESKQAAH